MFIYVLSIAFQLSGALLLLLFSISVNRKNVIKRFYGNGIIKKDNNSNTLIYSKDAFKETFKITYISKISFGCIALGYILGVFAENNNQNKLEILLWIIICTISIMLISYYAAKFMVFYNKSATTSITSEELEECGISPDVESIPDDKIENLFNKTSSDSKSISNDEIENLFK